MIFVFETEKEFLESDRDRLEKFVVTGLALVICTIFAEAPDAQNWPKVIYYHKINLVQN